MRTTNPNQKHFNHLLLMLLFLCTLGIFTGILNSQSRVLHKPAGLNTWTPSHLLPRIGDVPGPDSVVRTDFTITLADGTIIDCLKWVPVRTPQPPWGYPTVIMVHGYGDNKNTLSQFCHDQATYGYYTMTFSMRGQGNSGGLSNLISRTEANDFIQIVNFVKLDVAGGVQPNNILVMGGSQGGLVPMQAACLGLNVKTLISSVAPPDFASSWIENGCIKMTLLWTIDYTPDTARYNGQVTSMRSWIYANNKNYWDSLAYWLPRDRDFVTLLPNVTMPVLIEAGWQDKFFNANGWTSNLHNLTGVPKLTSYIGAVLGHGGESSPTETQWHLNWFNNWFYETLFGIITPITYSAPYQFASTQYPVINNAWTFTHDSTRTLMKNITTPSKLYFRSDMKLMSTTELLPIFSKDFRNNVTNGYTLQQIVFDDFTGTNFTSKFKKDSLIWLSNALVANMQMTGAPTMHLDYSANQNGFIQYNFQIYEVLPDGTERFVNRINYTDRSYVKNARKTSVFKGQAHSHIFKAGNKIKIKAVNFDKVKEDVTFFGNAPFVLPVTTNSKNKIYCSANTYIELPIVGSGTNSAFFNQEDEIKTESPYKFSLNQNYPNPFNPSTMIEYSIANAGLVQLKVYDVLGREVATLVNQNQNPGSYNVLFNASNLSSGVYFYKIESGSFTQVKRMILVK